MQIQADALQRTVLRPANLETTAFGAARLAIRADLGEPPRHEPNYTRIEPRADLNAAYERWQTLRAAAAQIPPYTASEQAGA